MDRKTTESFTEIGGVEMSRAKRIGVLMITIGSWL
jgi:hypothetical protein